MNRLAACLCVLLLLVAAASAFHVPQAWAPYEHVAFYNATSKTYRVQRSNESAPHGLTVACRALYNRSFMDIGWDYVHIAPTADFASSMGAEESYYAAGFTEGFLTAKEVAARVQGSGELQPQPKAVREWISTHRAYMKAQVEANGKLPAKEQSKFWRSVGNILSQIRGLADGYAARKINFTLTEEDFFYWNFRYDLDDVASAVNKSMRSSYNLGHCSAIVKVTTGDIFVSHNSWMTYTHGMGIRHYKTYELGSTVILTTFPGQVFSGDDWYMTSKQLAVQETTNGIYDNDLYELVMPQSVSEFIRVMVANYEATNGKEWGELFAYNNSGTYNNQFMVVDMKLFAPGEPLKKDLLWVHEQLPGSVTSADVTDVLRNQSYWASYNIPYFPHVYDLSGYAQMEAEYGSFFSYTNYSRAEIFRARQGHVADLQGMKDIMRYNDYLNDPFSLIPNCSGTTTGKCVPPYSAMLSIASRGDLQPAGDASAIGPLFHAVGRQMGGAIDAKITSWKMFHQDGNTLMMKGVVICGPTSNVSNKHEPFRWSTSPFAPSVKPADSADLYDYDWVEFEFPTAPAPPLKLWPIVVGCAIGVFVVCVALAVCRLFNHEFDDEREKAPLATAVNSVAADLVKADAKV